MKKVEIFEIYHLGKMSNERRISFEKELQESDEMRQDYRAFVQVYQSLQLANNERLEQKVGGLLSSQKSESKRGWIKWATYAAAASILFALIYKAVGRNDNYQLYSKYYQVYEETNTVLGTETRPLDLCIRFYNQERYKASVSCLNELAVSAEKYFYSGICFMELNKPETAISNLEQVEKLNGKFLEEANWYLSLLYLRKNDKRETQRRLTQITQNKESNYKKSAAAELLKAMNP